MSTLETQQEETLWVGNLPYWADEEYLCICFFHFDSIPWHNWRPGRRVKIVKDEQTGHSKGYGFMVFNTRDEAEKILYTYNRLKIMPGTTNKFCMSWAFPRPKGGQPKYKNRTMNSSNNDNSALPQHEKNKMDVKIYPARDYIPLDLIETIFLWLPAESIMRLRRECKTWSLMTRSMHFTYQHLKKRRSRTDPVVAVDRSKGVVKFYFLSNYGSKQVCSFRVLHFIFPYGFVSDIPCFLSNSCNGLVCAYQRRYVNLVNPTIRETVQLPNNFAIYETKQSLNLSVGIGYDDSSDTYKIIRIYGYEFSSTKTSTKYEIFTLGSTDGSSNWRQLEEIPHYVADGKPPVFLNGAIHWILLGNPIRIHSFNVRTDIMHILPVPEVKGFPYLIELRGYLCLIDRKSTEADLYILEDYANWMWIKKHTIVNFPDNSEVIATRDGKLLFHNEYYDMKDGMFKKTISQSNYAESLTHCLNFRGCAESLISPISYLKKSNTPCAVFSVLHQTWAAQFPMNTYANSSSCEKTFFFYEESRKMYKKV